MGTSSYISTNMWLVGEAITTGIDCRLYADIKAYVERKYPRYRKIPVAHIASAVRYIGELDPNIQRGFWDDCKDLARCDNEGSKEGA